MTMLGGDNWQQILCLVANCSCQLETPEICRLDYELPVANISEGVTNCLVLEHYLKLPLMSNFMVLYLFGSRWL